ncbi:TetR family transcriptional regulator [Paenibacillus mucilaginosus 3016]|uniref:TetR family transcriptional regulator n=2 Tax=Paenibacillus mucilaginosus TaxID=61624 RepID=H6NIC3_9BACL|nr:TetR/AcrR family transcriptional regulator [Paenibacillus mucilaginosus]AFC31526.1 TetR family transcriptional regulator [Paenibacillus mucilaginosus 3016]AFH63870.1 TetR family transcriptional regulator [Paenibacillus mucilaginosus K02]WFA20067.1 TetR/AcrR family transcriptional regulator [Paenibacillus mucilaginosus]
MAPLNDEQLHQIRDERREQIRRAGLKVFARRGILGTKMSMIASEAGISHGLVYHYFKSKDELFISLVEEAVVSAAEAVQSIYSIPGTPMEKLRLLTAEILDPGGTEYFLLIHQARTSDGVPEQAKELIATYSMRSFIDTLIPLFTEGQRTGEIVSGNPEDLIASYLSIISGLMVLHAKEGEYRIPETALLLRMLTPP